MTQDALYRARELYAAREWRCAHDALSEVDGATPLDLPDLWRVVWAASLCGREQASHAALERIYHAHADAVDPRPAARAAFWLGFHLARMGEPSRAGGWLARAERCVERAGPDCVERGYLQIARVRAHFSAGELEEALGAAALATQYGERYGDSDLRAWAVNLQGRIQLRLGNLGEGLRLFDEAMLAVTGNDLSPAITALAYCAAIDSCQSVYALERVREWTEAMRGWCDAQPQLNSFTGECLVKRAEVLELAGHWDEALLEAQRAQERYLGWLGPQATGESLYRQGEIHRLRGEHDAAEELYQRAADVGWDPQPGLSELRLAQGRGEAALHSLRRALLAAKHELARAKLLPPLIETLLSLGKAQEARIASTEMDAIAKRFGTPVMAAVAGNLRGMVELGEGDGASAIVSLRDSFDVLRQLGAPYLAARARVQLACAYRMLGDDDGARLEMEAARRCFAQLGAQTDLAAVAQKLQGGRGAEQHGLTARELEVLRLVASGKTNKQIAIALCLAEKTVDRHVSNILSKLDVPSRAGATAFAYEKRLI